MSETYFQSLIRENHEYALRVETLIQQVSNLNGLLEEKNHIIQSLRADLMAEEHKVNRLLKGEPYSI